MNCYLITYDLLVPGRDYTGLYTQIKSYHFWWHHMQSIWLVVTEKDISDVSREIKRQMDDKDNLFIVDITGRNRAGWLTQKAWSWISRRNAKGDVRIRDFKEGMQGPYDMEVANIRKVVGECKCGNYRLTRVDGKCNFFRVDYIGRSDSQLAERICDHVKEGYTRFVFCPKDSPAASYRQECSDYHYFGGILGVLDNDKDLGHPHSPEGLGLKCHICGK